MAAALPQTFALPAVVDLDAIEQVRDRLLDALERGPVTVDAAGVDRVATNGLFMLLSAAETARRNHANFCIAGPSAALSSAIGRLGLDGAFAPLLKG